MDDQTPGQWPGSDEGVYAPPAAPGHSHGDGRGQQAGDVPMYGVDENGNPVRLDQSQADAVAAMAAQFARQQPPQQAQQPQGAPAHPWAAGNAPRASQAPPRPQPGQAPPPNIKTKRADSAQTSAAEQPGAAAFAKIKASQRASTIAEAIKARQDGGQNNRFPLTNTMPGMEAVVRYPSIVSLMTVPGLIKGQLQVWVSEMLAEGVNGKDGAAVAADTMNQMDAGDQLDLYMELCQATALVGFIDPPLVRDVADESTGNMWVGRIDFRDLIAYFNAVQEHQAGEAAAIAPFPGANPDVAT